MGMACGKCRSHANPRMHSVGLRQLLIDADSHNYLESTRHFPHLRTRPGAEIYPTKAKSAEGRKNVPCLQMVNRVETLVRNVVTIGRFSGDYHWPVLGDYRGPSLRF